MADDARGRHPGDPDEPTQEHRALPDDSEFDPTLAPPSDPYVDDAGVTPAADDHMYDPNAAYHPPVSGYDDAPTQTWSGRAGVPPPGTGPGAPGEEWPDEEEQEQRRGAWYLPVIFGVLLAILLALLGVGLWLALRNNDQPVSPIVTPTATATTPGPTPTPSATVSPTPSPTASQATVDLPNLSGVGYADAVAVLKAKGLVPNRVDQVNTSLPAGTVINTDPRGPTTVPVGSTVTLFVAVPPPATSAPASPTASPSS